MGKLLNWAEVKAVVGTGQLAEVDHQWVIWADVVVQSDAPAAVVKSWDCLKVFSDPFKVASLLMDWRVGVPKEGKGKHFLTKTSLPRVSGAGRKVTRLLDSEEKAMLTISGVGVGSENFSKIWFLTSNFWNMITYTKSVGYFWNIHIVQVQKKIYFGSSCLQVYDFQVQQRRGLWLK